MARWYENFLDVCRIAKKRGLGIACHPDNKAALQDMMERVFEDDQWRMGDLPPLLSHPRMPVGEYRFVEPETLKVISMAAANNGARTGMGRYDKLWTPDNALKREN